MKAFQKYTSLLTVFVAGIVINPAAQAENVVLVTTFVTGTSVSGTNPDSICYDGKSIWVE